MGSRDGLRLRQLEVNLNKGCLILVGRKGRNDCIIIRTLSEELIGFAKVLYITYFIEHDEDQSWCPLEHEARIVGLSSSYS